MSRRSSGKIQFDCGFDHGQTEPCTGHTFELIFHNTSDTVSLITDDKSHCMSDGEYCALLMAIEKLDDPPADTPLNFRTRIHLAPSGEVQYVHLEKDGQKIGMTIEQATSLFNEIGSRLGLTREG